MEREPFNYFRKHKFDIVCLQECHVTQKDYNVWEKQWGGKVFFNEGTNRRNGEVILVSKYFAGQVNLDVAKERIITVTVKYGKYDLKVCNLYAPNNSDEKLSFFSDLQVYFRDSDLDNLILFGDFNCVLDNHSDIISGQPHKNEEVRCFNHMINALGLKDSWRALHDTEKDFTWSRCNPFIARRLDYCFVSEDIFQSCSTCDHLSVPNSDHKVITMKLDESNFVRGPGYWKFNNSFLKDDMFVSNMNMLLDDTDFQRK